MSWLDCDYSSIESRIVCWIAGQEDALQEYRDGVDRYRRMASFIYRVPEDKVSKHPQRFVGKQCILGCGYQMGPPKFRATCWKMGRYDLPQGLEQIAVKAWREKHPKVVNMWYAVDRAVKRAILQKGQVFEAGKMKFTVRDIEGMTFLLLRLPSGRKLAYPKPRIQNDRIIFYGNIKGATWGDVDSFGAKFVENGVQGIAADIMAQGTHNAENAGYQTATLIHDENLSYYKPGQTVEEFIRLLTTMPAWCDGLPLAAEGEVVSFYKK